MLGILRFLSRRAKDAASVEPAFSRVFDARYGYLVKRNLPLSKAVVAPVAPEVSPPASAQPPRASKPDGIVFVQTKAIIPPVLGGRYCVRGAPRSPPRRAGKSDDRRRRSRARSRQQASGDRARVVDKKTRDERLSAWGAGVDGKGSLRDLRKNCYSGTGADAPRRKSRSRRDLGNPRHLPRRAPGREGKEVYHWARDRPNRQLLEGKMRRRVFPAGFKNSSGTAHQPSSLRWYLRLPSSSINRRAFSIGFRRLWIGTAPPDPRGGGAR